MIDISESLDQLRLALADEPLVKDWPCLNTAARVLVDQEFPTKDHCKVDTEIRKTTKPALKSLTIPLLQELRYALANWATDADVERWANKLLRVCEIRRSSIRERLAVNKLDNPTTLRKSLILACFFLEYFEHTGDARFVNFVLKLLDQPWLPSNEKAIKMVKSTRDSNALLTLACNIKLEHAIDRIKSTNFTANVSLDTAAYAEATDTFIPTKSNNGKRVVIFSPSRFSLYTLAVTEMLRLNGIQIDAIVVRRLLNPSRAILEFRRDGMRLVKKAWQKLVLKRGAYEKADFKTLPELLSAVEISDKSVNSLAARHGIDVIYCNTLNDASVHEHLKSIQPDCVVFTGGGIIREKTLELSGHGVINCHMGQLPNYRGMDVVEWPLLENQIEALGFTVHFMARGIDTGDILTVVPVDTSRTSNIKQLRSKFESQMCCSFVKSVTDFLNGQRERRTQTIADGRQYFIIHERFREIGENRLNSSS